MNGFELDLAMRKILTEARPETCLSATAAPYVSVSRRSPPSAWWRPPSATTRHSRSSTVATKLTTRQRIQNYLAKNPGQTAWQISQGIKKSAGLVSAVLAKDVRSKKVSVSRRKGPRGGRAYVGYKA